MEPMNTRQKGMPANCAITLHINTAHLDASARR